jgi:uncharacterized phiE125 gp8 family phage protein
MIIKRVSISDDEPLSIAEVRVHLRNPEITSNDAELLDFIKVAREQVEHKLSRAIITQTWDAIFDGFPPYATSTAFGAYLYSGPFIELPYPPLQSVTSITYYDADNVAQTLASSAYTVDTVGGIIRLATNESWPSSYSRYDAVTVRYVAGWATPEDIPAVIKAYMKLCVEAMDKNRSLLQEREMTLTPFAERLLDAYRMPGV